MRLFTRLRYNHKWPDWNAVSREHGSTCAMWFWSCCSKVHLLLLIGRDAFWKVLLLLTGGAIGGAENIAATCKGGASLTFKPKKQNLNLLNGGLFFFSHQNLEASVPVILSLSLSIPYCVDPLLGGVQPQKPKPKMGIPW